MTTERSSGVAVIWPYWSREDVRAGWADAMRTDHPRILAGRRWGQLDYAAGYAIGAMRARWSQ